MRAHYSEWHTNVECFSGHNEALTTVGMSNDFLCVEGNNMLTISLVGCRMQGYASSPLTVRNPNARISMTACFDYNGNEVQP